MRKTKKVQISANLTAQKFRRKKLCDWMANKKVLCKITAPFYYEDSIAKSIRRLKFYGKEFLTDIHAERMAECVKSDFKDINANKTINANRKSSTLPVKR